MKTSVSILSILIMLNITFSYAQGFYGPTRTDHVMLHSTGSVSLLDYKSIDSKSSISPNIGVGVEYAHFFGKNFGLSIGAELTSFSSYYRFNGRRDSLELFDNWSSRYYKLRQNLTTLEHQRVTYLSIPAKLNFRRRLAPQLTFHASAGAAYTVYLTEKQSVVAGTIDRQAFFGDIFVNIDDFRPLMFGKFNDFINPSSQKQFTKTLLGIAQLGVSFNIAKDWDMHTELNFQYGFENIKLRNINILVPDEYSGVTATNYIGNILPMSVGLRVGVTYKFDLFNVGCMCDEGW